VNKPLLGQRSCEPLFSCAHGAARAPAFDDFSR
jgi:hypothetical protein